MAEKTKDAKRINARPTKVFFIEMLTRDILLIPAIIELVDNSIDGAKRMRGGSRFDGLWISIEYSDRKFQIADNCGGIPLELARDYAFRFGRPIDYPADENAPGGIGRFGVGMKRAIFKLGNRFHIESTTNNSRFTVDQNVQKWLGTGDELDRDWDFRFRTLEEKTFPDAEVGTKIILTELFDSVRTDFKIDSFSDRLRGQISQRHPVALERGLTIRVNGIPVGFAEPKLLVSSNVRPVHTRRKFRLGKAKIVNVELFAGVASTPDARADRVQSGWHVYCNGRQVLSGDKTSVTGWGSDFGDGIGKLAGHHPTYNPFQGYVFFDSLDPTLLPWTTTKDSVDVENEVYRRVRVDMRRATAAAILLLNDIDYEHDLPRAGREVSKAVSEAKLTQLTDLPTSTILKRPPAVEVVPKTVENVLYKETVVRLEKVRRKLRVGSNSEAGRQTFDYFYRHECEGS